MILNDSKLDYILVEKLNKMIEIHIIYKKYPNRLKLNTNPLNPNPNLLNLNHLK